MKNDKTEATEKFVHFQNRKAACFLKAQASSGFFILLSVLFLSSPSVSHAALVSEDPAPMPAAASQVSQTAHKTASAPQKVKSSKVLIKRGLAPAEKGAKRKKLRGQVGAKNMNGMAVVFEKDDVKRSSKEMWFPFGDETYLADYETLDDVQEGDEVSVTYDESAEGVVQLKGISLVRKAPVEAEQYDPEAEAEE